MNHAVATVCRATFQQRVSGLRPRASQSIYSLTSHRRDYHISTPLVNLSAHCRPARLARCSSAAPYLALAYPSPLTSPNARWISHSRPRYEAAEKQSPPKADNDNAAPITAVINHQPPLPIRIALVSSATALATPAFPALGFLYTVLRVTIPDASLRNLMEGRWGTVLSFTTWTLLPNLYHGSVASLILPCAIGNAIVAGGVYGLVDVASGGPSSSNETMKKVLQTPWLAGSGIGATVGYIAPNHLYGPIAENLYAMEGMSNALQYVMNFPFATEVSVVTGAIAGMILHPMLYFPTHGISGVHWGLFSGTALAAVTSALFYVYYAREGTGLPVPKGSFIDPSKMALVDSIMRYNNSSGEVETYSLKEQRFIGSSDQYLEGQKIAKTSRRYAGSDKVVFDDRSLAFVYNFWDEKAKLKYPEHVVSIRPKDELRQTQNCMSYADASVAAILNNEKQSTDRNSDVTQIMSTIHDLNSSKRGKKQLSSDKLEEVSIAIELLMIMRNESKQEQSFHYAQISTLESFIRGRYSELVLYASDEQYEGESVESQLRICGWKSPELSQAMNRWKKIHKEETYRTWKNRALFVTTGVLLSLAGAVLQGSR